jgi:SAM-dependent methyltransferase
MSGWGSGYITDIAYIPGFYQAQMQSTMALAALLSGKKARLVGRHEAYHYADIGCGLGMSALIVAAANPGWQVTGLDFNPAHIAAAREMARQTGLSNINFIEADFTNFAESAACQGLAEIDAVSMHGVWSWVAPAVQDGILRLLNAKLAAGGLMHVSYNVLPAWRGALGLQRLIREAGLRHGGRSDKQARAGADIAVRLAKDEAGGKFLEGMGNVLLDRIGNLPVPYLAHEFMNRHWAPCFHLDVAERFAGAKMVFVGSCHMLDNFPQLSLSEGQRAILQEFDDPGMAELIKDLCMGRSLRNDVFMRGAVTMPLAQRDAALLSMTVALSKPRAECKLEFDTIGGTASLSPSYYEPVFDRLSQGPATIEELLALPDLVGRRDNPAELIGVLMGTNQAVLVPNPGAPMDRRCTALNAASVAQRGGDIGETGIGFAVPALGGGFAIPGIAAIAVLNQQAALSDETPGLVLQRPSPPTLDRWVDQLEPAADDARRGEFMTVFRKFFDEFAPVLNDLGIPC